MKEACRQSFNQTSHQNISGNIMKQNIIAYKNYPYYNPSFAAAADGAEWRARNRRVGLFAQASGLKAVNHHTQPRLREIEKIKTHMRTDHLSAWQSPSGALFILNEPYLHSDEETKALQAAGYEVRVVPNELAPYGGGFDGAPGAAPWTTSLLITKVCNVQELDSIHQALLVAAASAPAWNK